MCKWYKVDINDSSTTTNVWNTSSKSPLKTRTKDDSQMLKLWKAVSIEDHIGQPDKDENSNPAKKKKIVESFRLSRKGRTKELDSVIKLMRDIPLSQVEA